MTTTTNQKIAALYVACFERAPDKEGLDFWNQVATDSGLSDLALMELISEGFANHPYFLNIYGGLGNKAFVEQIYINVGGKPGDTAGIDYWTALLNGGMSRSDMVANYTYGLLEITEAQLDDMVAAGDITEAEKQDALDRQANMLNKVDVGLVYVEEMGDGSNLSPSTDPMDPDSLAADPAYQAAQAIIAGVNEDPTSMVDELAYLQNTPTIDGINDTFGVPVTGQTFILTKSADNVVVTTNNTIDTVKGFVDGTDDTLTTADTIDGNGNTVLQVVNNFNGPRNAPYFEMSGVDKIAVVAATSGSFFMDASTYGSDISNVVLSGEDGFYLSVTDLEVQGSLNVAIAGASDSSIWVSGEMGAATFSVYLSNSDADTVGALATVGTASIDVKLGEDDYASIYYYQSVQDSKAAVSVGDLLVGAVSLDVGQSATASVELYNDANNTAATGSATAGNVTVGDVAMAIGTGGDVSLSIYNSAEANSGAATVGNVTVGNIDVEVAASGQQDNLSIWNYARTDKGNATAGNVTVGDTTVVVDDSAETGLNMWVWNDAGAWVSGNAKVGNIVAGAFSIVAGDDNTDDMWGGFSNWAYANNGSATAGNITVGDVSMSMGDNGISLEFYVSNEARVVAATSAKAATVGNVIVGNVDMAVGSSGNATFYLENIARTNKGAATAGTVTVGNLNFALGIDADFEGTISNYASGTAGDKVGNVAVGDITFYAQPLAGGYLDITSEAVKGSVADVAIGDVDVTLDNSATFEFSLDVYADTNVGNVTIGNLDVTLGSDASFTTSNSVTANKGDIASFTIGDVMIDAGVDASVSLELDVSADDDIGSITIGDVMLTAAESASISMSWDFFAGGDLGAVSMGDVTLSAAESADVYRYFYIEASNEIAGVTVGDVSLSAAGDYASIEEYYSISASDDIGDITFGDLSVAAVGYQASAEFTLDVYANGNTIGAITFGDVHLHAKGYSADVNVTVQATDTGDTVGLMSFGDITLMLENTATATSQVEISFSAYSNGDVSVGDVTLTAGAVTAGFDDFATVEMDLYLESGGNLTVGNIAVAGGYSNGTPTLLDNFDVFTDYAVDLNGDGDTLDPRETGSGWAGLVETGSGSITIGNIDYSAYEDMAVINVAAFKGAAVITAAQDDTIIIDNKTKNDIHLGDGDDIVVMNEGMSTDKTDPTKLDAIHDFMSGSDLITINTTSGQDDFAFVSAAAASYAAFLTAAGNAMTNDGIDIYARKVGGDMYVAFDKDAGGAVDFVIKLVGVDSVVAGDFNVF